MQHPSIEPLESRIAPAAVLSINDAKIVEGDPDSNPFTPDSVTLTFTASLSEASDQPTTFTAVTRNGTAVAGEDFTALSRSVTIPAGSTSASINVTVRKDAFFESTESFFVEITNPSANVTVLDGDGRGTIYNDDIQRVDLQTIRFVDTDGDLATVRITKGELTTSGVGAVLNFGVVNDVGGRALRTVDFTSDPVAFNRTDLFVTATAQPGFAGSGGVSDGRVDVGEVRAGVLQGSTFQFVDNIDLGTVVIKGDLGKIVSGDAFADDRAVESLSILSHGVRGTTTGAPDNVSYFLGGATQVTVNGDVQGQINAVGSDRGDIERLTITGALRGGDAAESGRVFFTGTLGKATIGAIIGGAGENSGTVAGNFLNDTIIGEARIDSLRVLDGVVGGTGAESGKVLSPTIRTVVVGSKTDPASVTGGIGSDSGRIGALTLTRVVLTGDLIGGVGPGSGLISSVNSLGAAKVRGSILGGAGADSGVLISDGTIGSSIVLGNVQGGGGARSGAITASSSVNFLQIGRDVADATGGNLQGGSGAGSGRVEAGDEIGAALIVGSIIGGTGNDSGGIAADGTLGILQIKQSLLGGSAGAGQTLINTGYVTADQIGRLLIAGDIRSGTNSGTALVSSGSVRAAGDIGELRIDGGIIGNSTARVLISATGVSLAAPNQTIRFLSVDGDTAFADIAGGYSPVTSVANPRGQPLNPDAQIGTVKFGGGVEATNVFAGAVPGADGRFGTADDAVITGTDSAAIRSNIARLVIQGAVATNPEIYGVVAQVITAAKVGGTAVALSPAAQDDVSLGSPTSNFRLRELAPPA